MKKVILLVLVAVTLLGFKGDSIYDGNVTEKEARVMQKAWCDYNQGRDFIKDQCE